MEALWILPCSVRCRASGPAAEGWGSFLSRLFAARPGWLCVFSPRRRTFSVLSLMREVCLFNGEQQ